MGRDVVAAMLGLGIAGLALAEPTVQVPIQGTLSGSDGAPLDGTRSLTFGLYASEGGGDPIDSATVEVALVSGMFSAMVPLDAEDLATTGGLWLEVSVDGSASGRVPVGFAARAAWAVRAATADLATTATNATNATFATTAGSATTATTAGSASTADTAANAERLGGLLPSAYQFTAAPGGGLALSGTAFSISVSTLASLLSSTPVDLNAGSTIGGNPIGASAASLTWTPGATAFGTVSGTPATNTFVLRNTGISAVTGLSVGATGGFDVSSTTCASTLAANATCSVVVSLAASGTAGARSGTLVAGAASGGSAAALLTGSVVNAVFGSGIDGDLTITSGAVDLGATRGGTARMGTYGDAIAYAVTSVSTTSVALATTANGFAPGDKALLVVGQSTPGTDVGNYDVVDVVGVNGGTVTLLQVLDATKYDDSGTRRVVLQRIPQYVNVTIGSGGMLTTNAWDGLTTAPSGNAGVRTGIVAFFASGTVNNAGTITATNLGYRGGADNNDTWAVGYGFHGEGRLATWPSRASFPTVDQAGGGHGGLYPSGSGCCHGNGGGGGAYGTAGGAGSIDGTGRTASPTNGALTPGGAVYGEATLARLFLGGGGGGGGAHSGTDGGCGPSDPECNRGGRGGGVVFIRAGVVSNTGTIAANGEVGFPQPGTAGCTTAEASNTQDGSGGAGAGGSILILATQTLTTSGTMSAVGGGQGCRTGYPSNGSDAQRGGAGGVGRIRLLAPTVSGSSTPAASVGVP